MNGNTEKMIVFAIDENDFAKGFYNKVLGFMGDAQSAITYASRKMYGGGVDVYLRRNRKYVNIQWVKNQLKIAAANPGRESPPCCNMVRGA